MTAEELVSKFRVDLQDLASKQHARESRRVIAKIDAALIVLGIEYEWNSPQSLSDFVKENVTDKRQRTLIRSWVRDLKKVEDFYDDCLRTIRLAAN